MTDTNTQGCGADALKPCPFCGGRAEIQGGFHATYVMCLACEVMGPNLKSREELTAAWNTRPHSPTKAEEPLVWGWAARFRSERGAEDWEAAEGAERPTFKAWDGVSGYEVMALYASPQPEPVAGEWVTVPRGPTTAMKYAFANGGRVEWPSLDWRDKYQAMIAAAPQAPSPPPEAALSATEGGEP